MRLKIFSDKSFLPQEIEPAPLLLPFWKRSCLHSPFAAYADIASELFELTTLPNAQYAVAPCDWKFLRRNETLRNSFFSFSRSAKELGKKTVLFFDHDSQEAIPGAQFLVFRPSMSRSRKQANEFSTPAWILDFKPKNQKGVEIFRKKQKIPTVGFCGCPHGGFGINRRFSQHFRWLYARFKNRFLGASLGRYNRGLALQKLSRSNCVRTNFIINDAFFVRMIRNDPGKLLALRNAFYRNTMQSDYVLCVRGAGNFSYRFYEALCCGRIPVLLDTDCVLPLENLIDYRKYCVWVPESEVDSLDSRIAEFHNSLTDEEFLSLQQDCRELWESHLSPAGYFSKISEILSQSSW